MKTHTHNKNKYKEENLKQEIIEIVDLKEVINYKELNKHRKLAKEMEEKKFRTMKIIENLHRKVTEYTNNKKLIPKHKDLFSLLEKEDLLYQAYGNLQYNEGRLTPGSLRNTIEATSKKTIKELAEKLKNNNYKFSAIRRIYIDKPGTTKTRPLGIPNFTEKIIQEAIRIILEAIYEPIFEQRNMNFGFRSGKAARDAIESITAKVKYMNYAIEGDIKGAYDNVNHEILMKILEKRIDDRRFLELIKQGLKSGVINKGVYTDSMLGTFQGGIASPILFNIYMDELDSWISLNIKEYIEKKNKQEKRIEKPVNPANAKLKYKKSKIIKEITKELKRKTFKELNDNEKTIIKEKEKEIKSINREINKTPHTDKRRATIRIHYVRYADDWILFTNGAFETTKEIKEKIEKFLKKELKLELSPEKTLITNLKKKSAKFLGFSLKFIKNYRIKSVIGKTHGKEIKTKRRTTTVNITPGIDSTRIKQRMQINGYIDEHGFPREKPAWSQLDEQLIILKYNEIIRGIVTYYYPNIIQKRKLSWITYILQYSCLKTLCQKYRSTVKKIIKKFGGKMPIEIAKKITKIRKSISGKEIGKSTKIRVIKLYSYKNIIKEMKELFKKENIRNKKKKSGESNQTKIY